MLLGLVQGWWTCGMWIDFLGTQHSLLFQSIFISSAQPVSILWRDCVYLHILTAWRLYTNYCYSQRILWGKHFYTNLEQCKVLSGYLSLGWQPGSDWMNMYIAQNVLQSSFQTGCASSPSYFQNFFLVVFLGEAFIINIIIIEWEL